MTPVHLRFGSDAAEASSDGKSLLLPFPAPVLGERSELCLTLPPGKVHREKNALTWVGSDLCVGWARGETGATLEGSVGKLYDRMLRLVGSRSLYRIWHFVPGINACENGLENYRLFCRRRAEAFRSAFGESLHKYLPAASAVGSESDEPVMLFVAGDQAPQLAENPEQIPAYQYPPVYGPRPPSFARASRALVRGKEIAFISGTASIKGSETIHPGDCAKQTETTLHNLSLISDAVGLGTDLGRSLGARRRFIVYIRRKEDFPLVKQVLEERLLLPQDEPVYLLADICRAELMVEIEATIWR